MENNETEQWVNSKAEYTPDTLIIEGFQVMQNWEEPIMDVLAKEVTMTEGEVLEIGFGMGISSTKILNNGCKSLTLIEAHPQVIKHAQEWKERMKIEFPQIQINIIEGFWQGQLSEIKNKFDGILFDAAPTCEAERDVWFFPFFKEVPELLKEGGVFTYYSNETKHFNENYKEILEEIFTKKEFDIEYKIVENLHPINCEYWDKDNMCIPIIRKKVTK